VTLTDPKWLALFVVLVALVAAYVGLQFARTKYTLRFTSVDLLESVAPKRPGWQRHVSAALMLLALIGLVIALAGPATTSRVPKQRGTILLAIDTSGSMSATDVAPSRIEAAQNAARSFVNRVPKGLKVGLVQFDSSARVVVSPTSDHRTVTGAIDALSVGGGTATASAITQSLAAISALPPDSHGNKAGAAIVLMSDGSPTIGENGLDPVAATTEATNAAKTAGVPIHAIAFGTDNGVVTINGEEIPVPADPDQMARIASGSGGKSFTAKSGSELNSIYSRIRNSVGYDTVKHDITEWFVAVGFVLALTTSAAGLYWMQRVP
jgi:Ca-activated chloride channel family protein